MKKSKLLTFIFSFFCGAGQMYHGYMKRGASFMLVFCGLIGIASFFYVGAIAVFLPVLWAYAFFDTYQIAAYTPEERAAKPDAWLLGIDDREIAGLLERRRSWLAWALVGVGAYVLYDIFLNAISNFFYNHGYYTIGSLLNRGPTVLVAVLMVLLGIWLLKNPNGSAEDTEEFVGLRTFPIAQAGQEVQQAEAEVEVTAQTMEAIAQVDAAAQKMAEEIEQAFAREEEATAQPAQLPEEAVEDTEEPKL